jgi:nicotinamidase-related amidase
MGAAPAPVGFQAAYQPDTLVLVDLHGETGFEDASENNGFSRALERCREALNFARMVGMPVAFVRHKPQSASMLAAGTYPSWLDGFRPFRSDMVFERAVPSCYASMEFADMARRSGKLILAGIFGETSCLATLIDGHGRNHRFTFLADACVSRGRPGISAETMHQSVMGIASLYSEVLTTDIWIESMSQRLAS